MSKKAVIITLVLVGVALAIVLGLVANSQSHAEKQYCNSLDSLESSLTTLTSLNPSTASKDAVQSDIDAIQSDWSAVKSDASKLSSNNQQALDSAWDSFQSAVSDLAGGSGSTEDVQNAAKGLESAVQSSADSYDCGIASSTTTSSS